MTIFKTSNTGVWIQFEPGKKSYFLGDCIDLDSIPNPRIGGMDLIQCWRRDRKGFQTLGKKYTPPGTIEFTLSELLPLTASWLEKVNCPFTLYAMESTCDVGVFKGWQRVFIVPSAEIMDDPITSVANHAEDTEIMHEFSMIAPPPRIDVRKLVASLQNTTETQNLNFVSECNNLYCNDDCGAYTLPCDNLLTGADADAGVATANILQSINAGGTWTATAADPYSVNTLNVMTGACFKIATGVNRLLVVRDTQAATPLQASYSDDNGVSWTLVNIGATNAEATTGPKALIALDSEHIWVVTSEGNVFFSDDGGSSWTDQDAAGASGGNALNAIDMVDENIGFAVGDTDTVIKTTDGGVHWVAATATGTGDDLLSVAVFNQHRVLIGTDSLTGGSLQMSFDGGATYEPKEFIGDNLESVPDMDFINGQVGLIVTTTVGVVSSMHHTVDGGHTWEEIVVPPNLGINAVKMCGVNEAFAVGNVMASGVPLILHLSG